MIEVTNPRLACDFRVCIPHVGATEHSTEGHDSHKMARQGWNATTAAGHHPKLWKHCNCADEQATHPQSVEKRTIIEVSMEQASEHQRGHCKRPSWKAILIGLISCMLHTQHTVEQPQHHGQGE